MTIGNLISRFSLLEDFQSFGPMKSDIGIKNGHFRKYLQKIWLNILHGKSKNLYIDSIRLVVEQFFTQYLVVKVIFCRINTAEHIW